MRRGFEALGGLDHSLGVVASFSLSFVIPGSPAVDVPLTVGEVSLGRVTGNDIVLDDPSISSHHARIVRSDDDEVVLEDLGSTNGTTVNGRPVDSVRLRRGDRIVFGEVECDFVAPRVDVSGAAAGWVSWFRDARSFGVSFALHVGIVAAFFWVVLFPATPEKPDFDAASDGFLEASIEPSPPGRSASGGPPTFDPQQVMGAEQTDAILAAITTASAQAAPLNLSVVAPLVGGGPSSPSPSSVPGGGGGVTRGFGKDSGFGQGLREWIGSGEGGIGISGRGKTLKTINEFSCYFVIHSGDWYAALDWRRANNARQIEKSAPGLPDSAHENYKLYERESAYDPTTGPFISYGWGYRDVNGKMQDARGALWEFTTGAMSNLLQFLRVASNDAIKGRRKPTAVVLDPKLVPYTYDKASTAMTWNAEGREALRTKLRANLPGGDFYSMRGYIWNPEPANVESTDFLVEYLLDVKPMPPFIYFTGNDDFTLTETEVDTLFQYVLRGGAIWGDSGFAGEGSKFNVAFRREMRRVIPDVDKDFQPLRARDTTFLSGDDAYFDLPELPPGMQYYQSPIEVIEIRPGVVSVVLTKNAYGNFLRYDMTLVNNAFQIGGSDGRGQWVNLMWDYRDEFFRGIDDGNIRDSYALASNILVYMLGRWPTILNQRGGEL